MAVTSRVIGTVPAGLPDAEQAVTAWTIGFANGVALEVWDWGATLAGLWVPDRAGVLANVCYRLDHAEDQIGLHRRQLIGSTCGRFARNIRHGRFTLDGTMYQLDRNIGSHHFHGGELGLHSQLWTAQFGSDADGQTLTFAVVSPDGAGGYPGELTAQVRYSLRADGLLQIDYSATTDRPTIVGLAPHAFWNLAGEGALDWHELTIAAPQTFLLDAEFLPLLGAPQPAYGATDLRKPQPIGPRSIDNCWLARGGTGAGLDLVDPGSGRRLTVTSDQPALALYSGDHLPRPRAGLCIQPGPCPDAPNRPDFPSARLDPGQTYRSRIEFRFDLVERSS